MQLGGLRRAFLFLWGVKIQLLINAALDWGGGAYARNLLMPSGFSLCNDFRTSSPRIVVTRDGESFKHLFQFLPASLLSRSAAVAGGFAGQLLTASWTSSKKVALL